MTSSKSAFQSNKDLALWWVAVCKSPLYAQVVMHARSEMMQGAVDAQQIMGANRILSILSDLPEQEDQSVSMPKTGLSHDLGVKRNTQSKPQPK